MYYLLEKILEHCKFGCYNMELFLHVCMKNYHKNIYCWQGFNDELIAPSINKTYNNPPTTILPNTVERHFAH